jgi:glutaminase
MTDPVFEVDRLSDSPHVSTGSLPRRVQVADALDRTLEAVRTVRRGELSDVYPALQRVDPDLVGLAIVAANGESISVGDDAVEFTLMSVAKPFVLALVAEAIGSEVVRNAVGVNATGLAFNSIEAVERRGGSTNPMVNPGAIATTALAPGRSVEDRWAFVLGGLSRLAGRPLALDDEVLESARATNHRNRALASLLHSQGVILGDPMDAVEVYTRQSCVALDVRDMAVMGATIANGGVNPATAERVIGAAVCHDVMAVMATAGLYETSGDWLWDVGLPGKSGISGAVVALSPGKGALGAYAPPLDDAGNSVRGQLAARLLARELGLDVFATRPG